MTWDDIQTDVDSITSTEWNSLVTDVKAHWAITGMADITWDVGTSALWHNSGLVWDNSLQKWKALKSGGGTGTATTAGGKNYVQYSDGTNMDAEGAFTYDETTNALRVSGMIYAKGGISSQRFSSNVITSAYLNSISSNLNSKITSPTLSGPMGGNIGSKFLYGISGLTYASSQKISGGSITTNSFTLNANTISGLRDPIYPSAATNKHYVDTVSGNLSTRIDNVSTGGGGGGGTSASGNFADYIVFQYLVGSNKNYAVIDGLHGDIEKVTTNSDTALHYANKPGRHMFVRSGTYIISTNLNLSSNNWLQGNGRSTFFITRKGWIGGVDRDNLRLSDFMFSGKYGIWIHSDTKSCQGHKLENIEGAQYEGGAGGDGDDATFEFWTTDGYETSDVQLINCIARNCDNHGFYNQGDAYGGANTNNFIFDRCQAIRCGSKDAGTNWRTGMDYCEKPNARNFRITNCYASGNLESGFHTEAQDDPPQVRSNIIIANCISEYNGIHKYERKSMYPLFGAGFVIHGDTTLQNCISRANWAGLFMGGASSNILDCTFDGYDPGNSKYMISAAIRMTVEDIHNKITIRNCRFLNISGSGIYIYNASGCNFSNNYFRNVGFNSKTEGTKDHDDAIGIQGTASPNYNIINGNTIVGCQGYGIRLTGGNHNTIINNYICNAGDGGIIGGTSDVIANNIMINVGNEYNSDALPNFGFQLSGGIATKRCLQICSGAGGWRTLNLQAT